MKSPRHSAPRSSLSRICTGNRWGWKINAMLIFLIGLTLCMQKIVWLYQNIDDTETSYLLPPSSRNNGDHSRVSSNPAVKLASSLSGLPVYTREMATLAIRPAPWTCGDPDEVATDPLSNEKPIFAFVHVFKAAGSTIRSFFKTYSAICKKTWMVILKCGEMNHSTIPTDNDLYWKNCHVKETTDQRREIVEHDGMSKRQMKKRVYPTVNNTVLKENVDIYGGHLRIGLGDTIFGSGADNSTQAPAPVRHIVFLRDPMSRFVSGILYVLNWDDPEGENTRTLHEIVSIIKRRIRGSRRHNDYWGKSTTYLLTPHQAETFANMNVKQIHTTTRLTPEEHLAEAKARMAIQNLVHYNVIMGMSERMTQSMAILRHALVSDQFTSEQREEWVDELFEEYAPDDVEVKDDDEESSNNDVRMNVSERDGVSTASVLEELKKDVEFMLIFEEYIKYEQLITDFAWK
eukprot:CAMPEP_0172315470 /NCGR_PEP_ID=MMETSP1058-20130122/25291_1 /TAXON_ID=83371 /ORGANISM="Detonula confervacea, Strain CCMP 353" /LENGTH=459 /DNA_ID=CAMNT_0013029551 /DNA_START=113 /DNA_END=1489 /DNA_ORIENTATION=-